MKTFFTWFHYKTKLRTKLVITLGILMLIGYTLLAVYCHTTLLMIAEQAMEDMGAEAKAEFMKMFQPTIISVIVFSIIFYAIDMAAMFFFTGLVTKRMDILSRQAEAVANEELTSIPVVEEKDEIGAVTNNVAVMAEKLTLRIEEAKKANSVKMDFLSRMSHDIRTPMNAIQGMVEIIKTNPADTNMVADCISKIDVSTQHLLILIDEMLDMSKLDGGKLVMDEAPFNMRSVIFECFEAMKVVADDKNVTMNLHADAIVTDRVIGCELYTKRVITNILNNAIKFNKEFGSVDMTVAEQTIGNGRVAFRVAVKDTGKGMSEEFLKKVFEPFIQENETARSEVYNGAGLGLPIVKSVLEQMGGRIEIDSKLGEGTVVTMLIPLIINDKAFSEEELRAQNEKVELAGMKVLLVEDNTINMEIARFMLEDKGMIVDGAENGAVAVAKFSESAPFYYDLVLMDIMMPVMDGIESAKHIRALTRPDASAVPIVALSANTYTEDINAVRAAGMNDHIPKPIDINQLYSVVEQQRKLYEAKRISKSYSQLFTGNNLV